MIADLFTIGMTLILLVAIFLIYRPASRLERHSLSHAAGYLAIAILAVAGAVWVLMI